MIRQISSTGIYHVMLRGINKQNIFEEHDDYDYFFRLLRKNIFKGGYKLFAYCLMSNHVHLLIQETEEEPLGMLFQRIGTKYVRWFNCKYGRVGNLFQDRFRSEAVENKAYFLTALTYIHLNPVKAGICTKPEDYLYSSYAGYENDPLISSNMVFKMVSKQDFYQYHQKQNSDDCLDDECLDIDEFSRRRLNDQDVRNLMKILCGCDNSAAFQALDKNVQMQTIHQMYKDGASLRQINRMTGVSIGMIQRCQNYKALLN